MPHGKLHPLRAARKRRNLTQQMLADFVGLGLATIARAEGGKSIGADARQRLCEYFATTSEELGLVPAPSGGQGQVTICPPVAEADSGEDDPMNRRQALQWLGTAGIASVLGTQNLISSEPWERLSSALSRSSFLDEATLTHLQGITTSYWQLRANMASRDLLAGVLGHLDTVTQLLQASAATPNRGRLYSIAGEVALIAGQMAFDTNDHASARAYYKTAAEAAGEGRNAALYAVALARTSFTYTETGDVDNALILVQRAQEVLPSGSVTKIHAWLLAIEAEAHANMGDVRSCQHALSLAERFTHEMGPDDIFWTGFSASRLAGYRGLSLVRLGMSQDAIAALNESLATMGDNPGRRRPRVLTALASAYVQQGDLEEACRLAVDALAIARQTRNTVALTRLRTFRQSLGPWRAAPVVKALDEQLLLA